MMGKGLPEVFNQGIDKYCFNRNQVLFVDVPFTSTFGEAELDPISRLVTSAQEASSIHKGFKEHNGVVVDSFPVHGKDSGHFSQDMRSQIGNFNPGEDKEAGVLSNEMKVLSFVGSCPADELIPAVHLPCCCSPTDASQRTILIKGDIFEMFTHCLAVTKIMISFDESPVENIPTASSHHPDLEGKQFRKGTHNGTLRVKGNLDVSFLSCPTIMSIFSGGEFDQPFTLKMQEEFPTSHLLETPIWLPPVPEATKFSGDGCSSLVPIFFDNGADEDNIIIGDYSAPDDKWYLHGPLYSILLEKTPAFF
jgi:hypothetical protein